MSVANRLIEATDWSAFQESGGPATTLGERLTRLLASADADEATAAYWRIENHVVSQGAVFGAAIPCVSVVVAALLDERPLHVRISILDLLYQILAGHSSEAPGTPLDVVERCRIAASEGLWILVREAVSGATNGAWDVLDQLDMDERLIAFRRT